MDFVHVDGEPAQHLVVKETILSTAAFIELISTEKIWETLFTLWANVYKGIPDRLVFDEGSQFQNTFVEMCKLDYVDWKRPGVQNHNALGIGERYHTPLRNTNEKLISDYPALYQSLILSMAVRIMNETLGLEGSSHLYWYAENFRPLNQ